MALFQRDGFFELRSEIVDLRKMGFVPMAGAIQNAGFIHHMKIDARIDPDTRVLSDMRIEQPHIAFSANAETGGECCRDPKDRLKALEGKELAPGFEKQVSEIFGGGLGCTHLLTLGQTLGRALPSALETEAQRLRAGGAARGDGERLFKRTVFIDGLEDADGNMQMCVQLADLHEAAHAEASEPMELLAKQEEVRVLTVVSMQEMSMLVESIEAGERHRDATNVGTAEWVDHSAELASLCSRRIMPGLGGTLFGLFAERPERRLLLDALLQLGPGFLQCFAALSDHWVGKSTGKAAPVASMGGLDDACYMWRKGGYLSEKRRLAIEKGGDSTFSPQSDKDGAA